MEQIAQLNQLFQLLHIVHIYGHGFCELSRMLLRKNVNNDVSKDCAVLHKRGYKREIVNADHVMSYNNGNQFVSPVGASPNL